MYELSCIGYIPIRLSFQTKYNEFNQYITTSSGLKLQAIIVRDVGGVRVCERHKI